MTGANTVEHRANIYLYSALVHIGKPAQNAYVERFNRTYRKHVLNAYRFGTIDEVREVRNSRYSRRPHDAIRWATAKGVPKKTREGPKSDQ